MISARNKLILTGFLAQALTWNSWAPLVLWPALWALYLGLHGKIKHGPTGEAITLLAGGILSYWAGKWFNNSAHFFLGDALIFLQLVRLLRPLNSKEKLISLYIACFHLAVLCTLAPNIRFVPIFAATVFLLPKTLAELAWEREQMPAKPRPLKLPRWCYAAAFAGALLAFACLPRLFAGSPIQLHGEGGDSRSLLETILDSSGGGEQNSNEVLLQVEGADLGYLRCYALTLFDGIHWSIDKLESLHRIQPATQEELSSHRKRRVRVKQIRYLGNILPTDGKVTGLAGKFFSGARETANGTIAVQGSWNTANNLYEYWVNPAPNPEPLGTREKKALLQFPEQSQALRNWLASVTKDATNKLQAARKVEAFLGTNFVYKLGAPGLNRLQPIDDFIFNAKEGHCERFASAMALFLRMEGIPSRLMIGYAPSLVSGLEGWRLVRFKDAHSWAEGHIEGIGWVQFDATPGGQDESIWAFREFFDALDLMWYSRVVNFDGAVQRELFTGLFQKISGWPSMSGNGLAAAGRVLLALAILVAAAFILKNRKKWERAKRQAQLSSSRPYRELLQRLQAAGFEKKASQTPFEFLNELERAQAQWAPAARVITETFCEEVYGRKQLSRRALEKAEAALKSIQTISRIEK
jgi:hypothetical protein